MRTTFIFLIFSSLSSFGQIHKTRLINPQTNSYFFYSGNSHDVKQQQTINYFYLISVDGDKINKKRIRVYTDEKSDAFIDSLKKKGFQKYASTTNLTDKYKSEMTLNSMDIHRTEGVDTIFRFILLLNLTKPNGVLVSTSDTIFGDKRQEIMDVIQNKKFTVRVDRINKTKLLDVSIESFVLTNPYRSNVFSAGSNFSIYLADKN